MLQLLAKLIILGDSEISQDQSVATIVCMCFSHLALAIGLASPDQMSKSNRQN